MTKIHIILGRGHGIDTKGKCSPVWGDGTQLKEWEFNSDLVSRIATKLKENEIECTRIVPETIDVSLAERCNRVNRISNLTHNRCLFVDIHANAGGGTGFEVFTSPGKTKADKYATLLIEQLQRDFPGIKMRKDLTDGDPDKESRFYVLMHTKCPAILCENLFMDNESDCRMLMDDGFRDKLADSYVEFFKTINNE